jgi:hypothetical protein
MSEAENRHTGNELSHVAPNLEQYFSQRIDKQRTIIREALDRQKIDIEEGVFRGKWEVDVIPNAEQKISAYNSILQEATNGNYVPALERMELYEKNIQEQLEDCPDREKFEELELEIQYGRDVVSRHLNEEPQRQWVTRRVEELEKQRDATQAFQLVKRARRIQTVKQEITRLQSSSK